ncbi:MAG: DHH family phosphoesterase [Burkholderiales bacterium]|nr:DHH family phosphoesterase [Phycisphaerae bacterium]
MTAFVDSCLDTLSTSANQVQRSARPRAKKLLKVLAGKTNILVTTHAHPDPDAVASCLGIQQLLAAVMPGARTTIRLKGQHDAPRIKGFTRVAHLEFEPWDDASLDTFDAIILLDTQPSFSVSPLPDRVTPTVVIDHHRGRGRRSKVAFSDIRPDVGATASIVFSYFMELQVSIDATLAAALLHAIESDLAGAAGQQSQLDTVAISGLLLVSDIRKLWQMRYVDLPASYYSAFARAINSAYRYDSAMIAHAGTVQQVEEAAMLADALLRSEGIGCVLVTAIHGERLILSLRSRIPRASGGEIMRRLVNKIGDGGGHRTKAGGQITLESASTASVERVSKILKRRLLRTLHIRSTRGVRFAA